MSIRRIQKYLIFYSKKADREDKIRNIVRKQYKGNMFGVPFGDGEFFHVVKVLSDITKIIIIYFRQFI